MNKSIQKWLARFIIWILGAVAIGTTLFLFLFVFWKGRTVISLDFLLEKPSGLPYGTDGGIFPALMGSLYLGGLSALMGGLLGIFCALYLSFTSNKNVIHKMVQTAVSALSGIPSIIFGLVSYTFLIYKWGMHRCLLSATITISWMILPFVTIRAKKIFDENGEDIMRESLGLGISKEYTLRRLIIPTCMVELISTIALGMAYGMGAVAPILYTGVVMQANVPAKLTDPFMSLPYHLYMLVNNGYSLEYAYGTAFVLMAMLLIIQLLCKVVAYFHEGAKWEFKKNRQGKEL